MASTLKVNTIAHTGGTNALTIASNGDITAKGDITDNNFIIDQWRMKENAPGGNGKIDLNGSGASLWERVDTVGWGAIGNQMNEATGIFTFPSTGLWSVRLQATVSCQSGDTGIRVQIRVTKNNGADSYNNIHTECHFDNRTTSNAVIYANSCETLINCHDTTNVKLQVYLSGAGSTSIVQGDDSKTITGLIFERKGIATTSPYE